MNTNSPDRSPRGRPHGLQSGYVIPEPPLDDRTADWSGYWEANYRREPYFEPGMKYPDYHPAYQLGSALGSRAPGARFEEHEECVRSRWEAVKGLSRLTWDKAKEAVRAAWRRLQKAMPQESDRTSA